MGRGRPARRPAWSTSSCGSAARAATRARSSGAGCCSRARSWRASPVWRCRRPARRAGARRRRAVAGVAAPAGAARALPPGRGARGGGAGDGARRCAGGRPLAARRAGRGRRRACPGRPGTSCAGWWPSWRPARATDDALEALRRRVPSQRAGRDRRGLPRAAPGGRRPGAAAARVRRGVRRSGAAGGRGAQRHGAGALHRRGRGDAAAWAARCWRSSRAPGSSPGSGGSFLTAWLVGIALVLQVVAAVAIRRLGRVRW